MERTKNNFIAHYKRALMDTYEWARDPAKLDRFIKVCCKTLNTNVMTSLSCSYQAVP